MAKKNLPKKLQTTKTLPINASKAKNSHINLIGLGSILLLGIIIYSNSFYCSFHFDDFNNIVNNPKLRELSNLGSWWNYSKSRMLPYLSFAINYHFSQLNVWSYHLVNLGTHLINTIVVWWLIILIFLSPAIKKSKIVEHKNTIALLAAFLFVSHPLATQSVTYIVQRMASMVTLFYLLSVALYLQARLQEKQNISKYFFFGTCFISAILAMLSKENAFTLPFSIIMVEIFLFRTGKFKINFKDYRLYLFIFGVISIIAIILLRFSFSIFDTIISQSGNKYTITPINYLLTQFSVIIKYIQLLFLPINQVVDYDFPLSNSFFEPQTLISFLILSALIVFAILQFNRNRIISFGIFWFFLTLAIESSFIPITDLIYEHRTYLPSFGFFLILTCGIFILFYKKYKPVTIGLIMMIILTNSYLTFQRNKIWKDDITFWNDNVIKSPNLARPVTNRGWAFKTVGKWEKALADYTKALQINPEYITALNDRGVAYAHFNQWGNAITDYSKAIKLNPKFTNAYANRCAAFGSIGQFDNALNDITKAIDLSPDDFTAYSNRGNIYSELKQTEKAIADFNTCIKLNPNFSDAYSNRGNAYSELNLLEKAIADYSKAIEIKPDFANAYSNRGVTYSKLGKWDEAISDYTKALEINPNFTNALKNREIAYRMKDKEKMQIQTINKLRLQ